MGAKLDHMNKSGKAGSRERDALEARVAGEGERAIEERTGTAVDGELPDMAPEVRAQIHRIRGARADGFQDAMATLAATGFRRSDDAVALSVITMHPSG